MDLKEIIIRLLEAAAIGALIGLEREIVSRYGNTDKDNPQVIFWGLRSYTLMALMGAISVYLGDVLGNISLVFVFTGSFLLLFILLSYAYSAFRQHQFGVTSEFAAFVVYLLGALVMLGEVQIAVFLGILVAVMLNYKSRIAPLIEKIGQEEISTTLKFAIVALIVLPLLPDLKFSLYEMMVFKHYHLLSETDFTTAAFFNPYSIWLFVVIMSAVSYVGYVLSKVLGSSKGIILAGALGGLVSSTAVTSAMAEKSKKEESAYLYPTVVATITACSIMLFRVLGVVMLFNPLLLSTLLYPIIGMIVTSGILLWWAWGKTRAHEIGDQVAQIEESPFQIAPALKFAGLVLLIKLLSTFALTHEHIFGQASIYFVSFFSGLADVDAITQNMAELSSANGGAVLTSLVATTAIIIAIVTNTAVKIMLAKKFGSKKFGTYIFRMLGAVLLTGVMVLTIVSLAG